MSVAAAIQQRRILLAAVGDAEAEQTWGGIPHHIVTYGRALGVLDAGLQLETAAPHWRRRRLAWNALRLITHLERGGYQFSESFLERMWRPATFASGDTLINVFQLYPQRLFERHAGERWFYIDQTLKQTFASYRLSVGSQIANDAIAREQAQFHAATGVIAQSAWAAGDVIANYGVPPERVHVAIAGANIDRTAIARWENGRSFVERPAVRPLKLVFVGKEWQRKGLDRLLQALAIARAAGANVELVVIGIQRAKVPEMLRATQGVTWVGFIDKRRELDRFLSIIGDCDVGCLLSRAEAGGISLREFARLGLPTLAPDVGGAPEYVLAGASDLVSPNAPGEAIAELITYLAKDRAELERRRRLAFEHRHEASWDAALQKIGGLVGRLSVA